MSNLNYVGSVAERFMKFSSSLQETAGVSENLFNAVSIYVPKSLASGNLAEGSYDPETVTPTTFALIKVTSDNYTSVLADGSALLTQWSPVFNDGANFEVTLYVIIFDDTGFAPTINAGAITWSPLTKAFKELYFISFFKTMFSEHYDGTSSSQEGNVYDDSNYFDMALALSYQCEVESSLSFNLIEIKLTIPEVGATDTNLCKILTHTRGDETTHCTTLVGSTIADRAEYFWGYLNLIGGNHSNLIIHNGNYLLPIVLGTWFSSPNSSGEYLGNKLAKIRLTGNKVKPTGNPSPLNSDVNKNLDEAYYTVLDDKNVGYFISIADDSQSNAELLRDRSINNYPINAYGIAKFIDYKTSMDMAKYATDIASLTTPVLANEETYQTIQNFLVNNITMFAGTKRIVNIAVKFPPYSEAKQGNWFKGTAVWSATYVDDLEGVQISGSVSF